jgi:hypothetical protein
VAILFRVFSKEFFWSSEGRRADFPHMAGKLPVDKKIQKLAGRLGVVRISHRRSVAREAILEDLRSIALRAGADPDSGPDPAPRRHGRRPRRP